MNWKEFSKPTPAKIIFWIILIFIGISVFADEALESNFSINIIGLIFASPILMQNIDKPLSLFFFLIVDVVFWYLLSCVIMLIISNRKQLLQAIRKEKQKNPRRFSLISALIIVLLLVFVSALFYLQMKPLSENPKDVINFVKSKINGYTFTALCWSDTINITVKAKDLSQIIVLDNCYYVNANSGTLIIDQYGFVHNAIYKKPSEYNCTYNKSNLYRVIEKDGSEKYVPKENLNFTFVIYC